jgi:hypothetical protein
MLTRHAPKKTLTLDDGSSVYGESLTQMDCTYTAALRRGTQ